VSTATATSTVDTVRLSSQFSAAKRRNLTDSGLPAGAYVKNGSTII